MCSGPLVYGQFLYHRKEVEHWSAEASRLETLYTTKAEAASHRREKVDAAQAAAAEADAAAKAASADVAARKEEVKEAKKAHRARVEAAAKLELASEQSALEAKDRAEALAANRAETDAVLARIEQLSLELEASRPCARNGSNPGLALL